MDTNVLLIDNHEVEQVLRMRECIAVQIEAFEALARGEAVFRPRIDTYVPCGEPEGYYRWGSCEGASHGVLAIRLKSDVITWPMRPDGRRVEHKYCIEPGTYCGLIFLYSTRNGQPLAILKDGHLQHMRVGGAAGIGTKLLARADASTVAILGSGGMAHTFLEAICAVREIRAATVYSPTEDNRGRFAATMSARLGIPVRAVATAQEAVKGSAIVATCTDSITPVLDGSWLEPGMHVVSLNPRECGADSYARFDVKVIQGKEWLAMEDTRYFRKDLVGTPGAFVAGTPEERERIPRNRAAGLFDAWPNYVDIVSGQSAGRVDDRQITHYQTIGNWGVQFSSVGALVHRKAREQGIGRKLPLDWFTQDIRN